MKKSELRQLIREEISKVLKEESSEILYHATYKPLLKKIQVDGLDTTKSKKAWDKKRYRELHKDRIREQKRRTAERKRNKNISWE